MSHKVSAVIPTYNRRGPAAAAIASALRQTQPLHELIVIDDGSTDGTWDDLQSLASGAGGPAIVARRQHNAGPSAARNAVVALATGDFIAFLDSDDTWHENKTARQLAVFDAHPELALVGCASNDIAVFDGQGLVPIDVDRLLFRNYFQTPGVMLRREVLAAAGGFAADMRRCEDYDLWLRIAAGHPCALLNEVLMHCGGGKRSFGESGLSASLWTMQAAELDVYRRWRARGGPAPKYLYALLVCWLRFARRAAIAAADRLLTRR